MFSHINIYNQFISIYNFILPIEQWFNAFTVIKSGDFKVYCTSELLFDPN